LPGNDNAGIRYSLTPATMVEIKADVEALGISTRSFRPAPPVHPTPGSVNRGLKTLRLQKRPKRWRLMRIDINKQGFSWVPFRRYPQILQNSRHYVRPKGIEEKENGRLIRKRV
jgi:hypothetical protein